MSNLFLYAITVLLWGSTWLTIEFQLGVVPPEVSVFYRYVIAALLLFAWCLHRRLGLRFPLRDHGRFLVLGILLFSLNYIAAYQAQIYITSALNAIAFSCMVWLNIINARLFFGVRAGARVLLGATLGIVGIVVLFLPRIATISLNDATLLGAMISISGALVASFGNMVSQSAQSRGLPVIQSNAWAMFYGAIATGGIALVQGRAFTFDFSVGYVASLLYLAVFGSVVAFGAYLTLLGRIGAHKVGYVAVMFPVVAVGLSIVFEGLRITPSMVGGVLLVLAGNIVILGNRRRAVAPRGGSVRPHRH